MRFSIDPTNDIKKFNAPDFGKLITGTMNFVEKRIKRGSRFLADFICFGSILVSSIERRKRFYMVGCLKLGIWIGSAESHRSVIKIFE